ncbi:MAG: hypothetical protein AAAB13_05885 [Pseudomonas sp.]
MRRGLACTAPVKGDGIGSGGLPEQAALALKIGCQVLEQFAWLLALNYREHRVSHAAGHIFDAALRGGFDGRVGAMNS